MATGISVNIIHETARHAIQGVVDRAIDSIHKIESEKLKDAIRSEVENVAEAMVSEVKTYRDLKALKEILEIRVVFDDKEKRYLSLEDL